MKYLIILLTTSLLATAVPITEEIKLYPNFKQSTTYQDWCIDGYVWRLCSSKLHEASLSQVFVGNEQTAGRPVRCKQK